MTKPRRKFTDEQRGELVREFKAQSPERKKAWAKAHRLPESMLYKWGKNLREAAERNGGGKAVAVEVRAEVEVERPRVASVDSDLDIAIRVLVDRISRLQTVVEELRRLRGQGD